MKMDQVQNDYPGAQGVIKLSNIDFSDDKNQALVCAELDDGGGTRTFHIVLLRRSSDGWFIENQLEIFWIT